jgi:hypothetical protein
MLARQALLQLSATLSTLFVMGVFEVGPHELFALDWL